MKHHEVRNSHHGCQPPARWFSPLRPVTTFARSRREPAPGPRAPSCPRFPLPHPSRGPLTRPGISPLLRLLPALLPALLLPGAASGQLVGGPIVPSGHLRLDIDANYVTWSERFGLRSEGGSVVEEVEPLGWNLSSDALGSDRLPAAALTEARLRTLFGNADYRLNLGSTNHLFAAHIRRVPLGFRLGVFPWLTVGASLPMVQRKLDSELVYTPGEANAGLAPPTSLRAPFMNEYGNALAEARTVIAGLCGVDESVPECQAGRAVLAEGDALLGSLGALFGEAVFFPLEGSAAGRDLAGRVDAVRTGLSDIGVTSFTAPLPLGTPLDRAAFDSLVVVPVFGTTGLPVEDMDALWEPGDLEVSAAIQVLNLTPRPPDPPGPGEAADSVVVPEQESGGGFRVRLGVAGTLRLGTGSPQDTLREFLDMEVAEGQMDIEARAFGGVDWARRVGLTFDVRYGIASPVYVRRSVGPPDMGFAPRPPPETVQWQSGNYLEYAITPQLLLTPQLAVGFVYRSFSRAADSFAGEAADVAALSLETEAEVRSMGVDVRYSSFLGGGFPVVARFGWEAARSGSGGRTPRTGRVRFGASLFWRLWGGGPQPRDEAAPTPGGARPGR